MFDFLLEKKPEPAQIRDYRKILDGAERYVSGRFRLPQPEPNPKAVTPWWQEPRPQTQNPSAPERRPRPEEQREQHVSFSLRPTESELQSGSGSNPESGGENAGKEKSGSAGTGGTRCSKAGGGFPPAGARFSLAEDDAAFGGAQYSLDTDYFTEAEAQFRTDYLEPYLRNAEAGDPYGVRRISSTEAVARAMAYRTGSAYPAQQREKTFVEVLQEKLAGRKLKNADVYTAAHMDRKLFSKILSDRNYKPGKDTCLALIFALRLPLEEANDWLRRAGYSLSPSTRRDVVLEYLIRERVYNLFDVNEVLERMKESPIGR